MKKPEGYNGPEVEIVLKDTRAEPQLQRQYIKDLLQTHVHGKRVGIFQKNDQIDGSLTQDLMNELKSNFELEEMQDFMNHIHMIKIKAELVNSKIAAQFVEWSMKKMIKEVEHVIESDINIKHSKIAANIEKIIDNSDKIGQF